MHRTVTRLFTLLLALIAVASAVPTAAPGQSALRGGVKGHVTLTRRGRGTALPTASYPGRAIGRHDAPASPEVSNVIVYLKDPGCGPDDADGAGRAVGQAAVRRWRPL